MNFTTVILRTHVSHVTVYSQNKDHSHIVHTYQKQILMRFFFCFPLFANDACGTGWINSNHCFKQTHKNMTCYSRLISVVCRTQFYCSVYTTTLFFHLADLNDLNNRKRIKSSCDIALQLFWISENANNVFFQTVNSTALICKNWICRYISVSIVIVFDTVHCNN